MKKLVLALGMGVMIFAQSMVPAQAATYSTCGKCGGTINMATTTRVSEDKERCSLREHQSLDCWIVTNYYQRICIYSCSKGCYYREDPIGAPEAGESRHVSISR